MFVRAVCWFLFLYILIAACEAAIPKQLKIALSKDSYPYMYVNEQGNIDGLAVDFWHEVAKTGAFEVQFVVADWPDTIKLLERGEVDIHGAIARTPERDARFLMIDLNIDAFSNVYIRRDFSDITALSELKPLVIGVVRNTGHIEALLQHIPEANFKYFSNVSELYQAALRGELGAFAGLDRLPRQHPDYAELNRLFPLYNRLALKSIELTYALLPQRTQLGQELLKAIAGVERSVIAELERRWLGENADKDTLLLGLSINNPPFMSVSQQGEALGLFVDLWRFWSEATGRKIVFVPDTSFNNIQNLLKGRIDVVIGAPNSGRFSEELLQAFQLYGFQSQYFTLSGTDPKFLDKDSEVTVALFENAPYVDEIKQRYPKLKQVYFKRLTQMIDAVMAKKVDGFFASSAVVQQRLMQLNMKDIFVAQPNAATVAPIYSVVRNTDERLAEEIRKGFNALALDKLVEAEQQWVKDEVLQYFSYFRKKIPFTSEENEWLLNHQTLTVGLLSDWHPMEFFDEEGKPAGITVDMMELLSRRIQAQIKFKKFANFDDLLNALKNREIDIIAHVSEREERKLFARFTDEFWSVQWATIGPNNAEGVVSTQQLNGKTVAILKDYQIASHLNDFFPNITVKKVETLREGLDLLQQNKVDFVLESVEAGTEMIRQAGYMFMKIQILDDLPAYPSLLAVRSDYEPLVNILNKGLRSIDKQERQQISQKWFRFQVTQGLNKTQLNQLIWQIGGAVALLLTFVVLWNLSLRREVLLRRQAEDKMRFMATHDDLTKLPNRTLIKERTDQALMQHARHNEMLALMFIDLDGFKQVNDEYGHDVGDELLVKLAETIAGTVRKSDTAARFGGDEFVVLLTGLLSKDDAALVAEKILHQLSQPISLSVGDVQVSASIGIAMYPFDGTDSSRLLKVADNLMYRIKQQGKNHYCFSKAVNS